ncbi:MAG: MFS transporter [Actinomycetes bacterium]
MGLLRTPKHSDGEPPVEPAGDLAPPSGPSAPQRTQLAAAFRHQAFRRVFAGSTASNVGTWMQNVTLAALAFDLRGPVFTGVVTFAQLGPMLFLSPVAGALADRVNRRTIMVTVAAVQTVLSLLLALEARDPTPSRLVIVLLVAGIGVGAALNAPAASATLPALVPRADLQSAIAVNSAAMNASRFVGPLLSLAVVSVGGAPMVFVVNAATYLFVVAAVCSVQVDFSARGNRSESPLQQLQKGLQAARADRLISRVLVTISVLSLCSLSFVYQMPAIAKDNLGLDGDVYYVLFACFALGAMLGAMAMGSFLSHHDRGLMARSGLFVFALSLALFGTTSSRAVAFPALFVLGASYFMVITALSTTLQLQVTDEVRGRVMGLWMMGWAGLVPLGSLIAGPAIEAVGISAVMLFGAAVALLLAATVDLRHHDYVAPTRTRGRVSRAARRRPAPDRPPGCP